MNQVIQFTSSVRILKGICLTGFIFCSSIVYSQSALNILDLYHESFPEKKSLTVTANSNTGDYSFYTNRGGISFQAVASPAENINKENISLDFENNRLIVKIGTKTFYPNLPYWQLAPIVNFTNSPYTVVVSQSGNSTGNSEAQCKFHPAFLDNLLGLRLFQADLLNLTDILWDLPIDAQRQYILASSEQKFTPNKDSILYKRIYEKLISGAFTSFVLTDRDVNVVFDIDESGLKFSGKPYYYFMKTALDTANIRTLRTQLLECYSDIETHAKILLKNEYSPALNPRTHLDDLIKALKKNKEKGIFNPYSMYYVEKAIYQLDSLNRLTDDEIGIQFQVLDDFSESFKSYWELLKKYNPPVYSAVENTAQWSAFFRYIRKVNPDNWSLFVKKAGSDGKYDAPAVQTPTDSDINYFRYFGEKEKGNP